MKMENLIEIQVNKEGKRFQEALCAVADSHFELIGPLHYQ